jgi:alkylhydroperoxidase family enzyme
VARLHIPPGDGGDAVQIWSLRPEMAPAVGKLVDAAYNKSILPVGVREAARTRIAQLNDCAVCLTFRADSVRAQGLGEELYGLVGTEEGQGGKLTEQERLAVEFAELFALDHERIDDTFVDRMKVCFTDAEILDLTICVAAFLGLGRALHVLGITETTLTDV